jgi:hypothetical protein
VSTTTTFKAGDRVRLKAMPEATGTVVHPRKGHGEVILSGMSEGDPGSWRLPDELELVPPFGDLVGKQVKYRWNPSVEDGYHAQDRVLAISSDGLVVLDLRGEDRATNGLPQVVAINPDDVIEVTE